jgi:hypothetical protein
MCIRAIVEEKYKSPKLFSMLVAIIISIVWPITMGVVIGMVRSRNKEEIIKKKESNSWTNEKAQINALKCLVATNEINSAPTNSWFCDDMRQIIIPIGKDNVATLYLTLDDLKALDNEKT